ncbi:MAG: Rne/Rng family ribonuclease [Lentisphaeria bacterium]|nr:Rne/Rng family ribonuclease [Lentisphaeria bacterium]
MENKGKQIILNCEKLERRFALLQNGRLEEYQIERDDNEPKVGDIYLGRIINLEPSLQAAFVDIGADKNAFLHYQEMLPGLGRTDEDDDEDDKHPAGENIQAQRKKRSQNGSAKTRQEQARRSKKYTIADIPNIFRPGMEILVQVVKSPISTKGARVTTDISIPGRFLVLMPFSDHIGLSSRIEKGQERDRLRKILASLELPEGMGLICRTVGEGRRAAFFKQDLEILLNAFEKVENDMDKRNAPALLYTEPNLIERSIRDFMTDEIDEIIVDSVDAKNQISDAFTQFGARNMLNKVTLHNSPRPVFEEYCINDQLRQVFQREVKLPTGGAIVVDETEALIAIDVNSGKGRKGAEQPEFILKTNLEAAEEIARQLRLRNVGGLVVIDFIDMRTAKDREEIFRAMKKFLKEDRAKTHALPLSRLGLMEMTRQREHESIKDQVFSPCPYCNGSGRVKSLVSMSVEIQRRLNSVVRDKRYKDIPLRVIVHPEVLARLRNEDEALLREIETRSSVELSFRADPALHYEEFKLIDSETGVELK